jgi:serine/threonine protein kinase
MTPASKRFLDVQNTHPLPFANVSSSRINIKTPDFDSRAFQCRSSAGEIVGRFVIGPQIGEGAFGKIFAARDAESGLLCAIKNESGSAGRKTLGFEIKVLRRIQGSPYFPRLFDSGQTSSFAWAAIELIGPSLASILKRQPLHLLSLSTAIRAARHSLIALHSLHSLGFIRRDIKPGNILVRVARRPDQPPLCLIDLVRIYRDQRTRVHEKQRADRISRHKSICKLERTRIYGSLKT